MKTIGIFDAKTRLSELCREVAETGESILIERRGSPIAELSFPRAKRRASRGILDDLAAFQAKEGARSDDGDFPEVWLDRTAPTQSPLS